MAAKKTIKIKQIGSPIRRPKHSARSSSAWASARCTRSSSCQDTPEVRGAIAKMPHHGGGGRLITSN